MYWFNGKALVLRPDRLYVCDERVEERYWELIRWLKDREAYELIMKSCEPMTKYVIGTYKIFFVVKVPKGKVVVEVRNGKVYSFTGV